MDVMTFHNAVLKKVLQENEDAVELAEDRPHQNTGTRAITEKIYRNIAFFGSFDPPHDCPKHLMFKPLRKIWKRSSRTEAFDWVFTEHRIFYPVINEDVKLATMLTAEELPRYFMEKKKRFYYKDAVENSTRKQYTDPIPRWDVGEVNAGGLNAWESKGSDGSIRGKIHYATYREDDDMFQTDHSIPVLGRSFQFCLDARQISEGVLGELRHDLLNKIALHHRIPREIQQQILTHLKYRNAFPYLRNLDIGEAYVPFPSVGGHCMECKDSSEDSRVKRTCPQAGLYIWNLALRCFHVFHKNDFNTWSLCSYGRDCAGHHDCSDHGWVVGRNPNFTLFIEKEAARGNNDFISLDQVGLGPVNTISLPTQAHDQARLNQFFYGGGVYKDSARDWLMIGGQGGIIDCMLHGRVIIGAWSADDDEGRDSGEESEDSSEDEDSSESANSEESEDGGTMMIPAQWALGRNLMAKEVAENAIKELHTWPGLSDLGGTEGKKYYYCTPKNPEKLIPYKGPIPRWDCGEEDDDGFLWRVIGNNGPLEMGIHCRGIDDDDEFLESWICIPMFRRSRQFCYDARQKSEEVVGREKAELFDQICVKNSIPPELRDEVMSYVTFRESFPYLMSLNTTEVYAPFPSVSNQCSECEHQHEETVAKRACPQSSLHIWNPALRSPQDYTVHHRDNRWEVNRDPEFTVYLETLAARGIDEFLSLHQVGLGPVGTMRLGSGDDEARQDSLFMGNGIYKESSVDLKTIGGLGGLRDAMLHGRVLIGVWRDEDGGEGVIMTAPQWALGCNLLAEEIGQHAIKDLHSWSGVCEWC
ncbi:hypothetical protein F53441_11810 [Fusarium austroafricanum]|uniref:Uncharacterized protein n=1 Tax=Fusarium austroafricanum TaxID=2364996 RepID=A0A8H4NR85_9HYPO|nr:hypothetical protein F53441_11810 [Fusarium austroafricanum]